jgi:pyocin large subunit-like protein
MSLNRSSRPRSLARSFSGGNRSRRNTKMARLAIMIVVMAGGRMGLGSHAFASKKAFPNGGKRSDTPSTVARYPSPTKAAPSRTQAPYPTTASASGSSTRNDPRLRKIGFRSRSKLEQHFQKHGREFGDITIEQYLAMAQDLRDAPLSNRIIEATQKDGTISRFDRQTGGFMAFDRDLTIRTFFHPNGGEDYFRRAANKSH